ncbi:hypothetical protein AVEN_124997-1 [Araneus ventricosus]|uniref:Uncharacterized protein n=1 Tax=Araneus ventricosus TaxID=182803 RepID=A0A4Y2EEJ2_ARAVE|nr:hypothetical protein AVEN_124997-1 [Araneus ventricosus]
MNSRRSPSPRKSLWELRFTTQTPSLTLARLARIEPTKPAGAGVVVGVLIFLSYMIHYLFHYMLQGVKSTENNLLTFPMKEMSVHKVEEEHLMQQRQGAWMLKRSYHKENGV